MKTNFVFSDESGSWGDSRSKFYVRCWYKISLKSYQKATNKYELFKQEFDLGDRETKIENWNKYLQFPELVESLFPVTDSEILFTYTNLEEFRERDFKVKEYISDYDPHKQDQIPDLKEKLLKSIDYVNYINIYEKYHFSGFYETQDGEDNRNRYVIDAPQFIKNDYELIMRQVMNNPNDSLNIHTHSERSLGLQVSGILASMFREILRMQRDRSKLNFLSTYVNPVLSSEKCNVYKGIKKVMWNKDVDKKSEISKNFGLDTVFP
jgi:hypothetical protein